MKSSRAMITMNTSTTTTSMITYTEDNTGASPSVGLTEVGGTSLMKLTGIEGTSLMKLTGIEVGESFSVGLAETGGTSLMKLTGIEEALAMLMGAVGSGKCETEASRKPVYVGMGSVMSNACIGAEIFY